MPPDPASAIRPAVRAMAGYTPGEQPRGGDYIKLNTNENPYPPSPRVFEAIRAALTGDRLRKYPDPLGTDFRRIAANVLGVEPDMILIGNGSDDILTILTRAFVPEGGLIVSPTPSYLLYRTLAEIQGARFQTVPYTMPEWDVPSPWPVRGASLAYVANPNSPSGTTLNLATLERFAEEVGGPLVIDEAYVDFADTNALPLLKRHRNVIITRSLSKSYSLAGIRFGFAVADAAVVRELVKVKDSYNCDALSLAAATAALGDQAYLRKTVDHIRRERQVLSDALTGRRFAVTPSQANFVWCRRTDRPVKPIYEALKESRILVRYMNYPDYGDGLRITVGAPTDMQSLSERLDGILAR
ncbi:MAG TPA: histidinol-phosphate transaminase [Gemmataceae bacterium]|jgi:histidinol-phosphate aminotransferase|nr:histidinol-phosphate transaminase [Gemmataceae bacterium]